VDSDRFDPNSTPQPKARGTSCFFRYPVYYGDADLSTYISMPSPQKVNLVENFLKMKIRTFQQMIEAKPIQPRVII
jgi:hypothetical protein